MQNEPTKKDDQATTSERPVEEVKDLPAKKVDETDADAVKGGATNSDTAGLHFKY